MRRDDMQNLSPKEIAIRYVAAMLALCHESTHSEAVIEKAKEELRNTLEALATTGFDGRVLMGGRVLTTARDFDPILRPGASAMIDVINHNGGASLSISREEILNRHADLCYS